MQTGPADYRNILSQYAFNLADTVRRVALRLREDSRTIRHSTFLRCLQSLFSGLAPTIHADDPSAPLEDLLDPTEVATLADLAAKYFVARDAAGLERPRFENISFHHWSPILGQRFTAYNSATRSNVERRELQLAVLYLYLTIHGSRMGLLSMNKLLASSPSREPALSYSVRLPTKSPLSKELLLHFAAYMEETQEPHFLEPLQRAQTDLLLEQTFGDDVLESTLAKRLQPIWEQLAKDCAEHAATHSSPLLPNGPLLEHLRSVEEGRHETQLSAAAYFLVSTLYLFRTYDGIDIVHAFPFRLSPSEHLDQVVSILTLQLSAGDLDSHELNTFGGLARDIFLPLAGFEYENLLRSQRAPAYVGLMFHQIPTKYHDSIDNNLRKLASPTYPLESLGQVRKRAQRIWAAWTKLRREYNRMTLTRPSRPEPSDQLFRPDPSLETHQPCTPAQIATECSHLFDVVASDLARRDLGTSSKDSRLFRERLEFQDAVDDSLLRKAPILGGGFSAQMIVEELVVNSLLHGLRPAFVLNRRAQSFVRVEWTSDQAGDLSLHKIRVSDNGKGLVPAHLKRLREFVDHGDFEISQAAYLRLFPPTRGAFVSWSAPDWGQASVAHGLGTYWVLKAIAELNRSLLAERRPSSPFPIVQFEPNLPSGLEVTFRFPTQPHSEATTERKQ